MQRTLRRGVTLWFVVTYVLNICLLAVSKSIEYLKRDRLNHGAPTCRTNRSLELPTMLLVLICILSQMTCEAMAYTMPLAFDQGIVKPRSIKLC